jgi:glycosyltransferase involved in cell wall biosynthesis
MISIIIPVFNAERWLVDCLDSIARQSCPDFEVLMVDDGSRDGSAVICKNYADKDERFHYYYQQNAGVSVARNTGLCHAKGEWISFIDSDDTIDTDFLKVMLINQEDFDAINCGYTSDPKKLGMRIGVKTISKESYLRKIIYERCKTPQLWSFVYRKIIIDSIGLRFTPGCVRNEDYEFFMKYLAVCDKPIALMKYVGYHYRQNPSSVMHQKRSFHSVIMSIEASSNVGETIEKIGVIPDKEWLTSFAVTGFLYIMSRENNLEIYNELHNRYPIDKYVKVSILHGGIRIKVAGLLYIILRKNFFFKVFSLI